MFNTHISTTHIKSLKGDLLHHNRGLRLCKSAQLTEALAFGFGFKTNAALRADIKRANNSKCLALREDRFWHHLSRKSKAPETSLRKAFNIDLAACITRATGVRDMREKVEIQLDRFFKLMADHGAAFFTIEGSRYATPVMGYSGFYRMGEQRMRPCLLDTKPKMLSKWDDASWSALMADDFLEDHVAPDVDLTRWAYKICNLLERDLNLRNIVLDAQTGITVHHDEIEGCTKSVVYQKPNQLEDVRAADASGIQPVRVPA